MLRDGHYQYLDTCYKNIGLHQYNILKLEEGDVAFLFKLMSEEIKRQQSHLNYMAIDMIEWIESDTWSIANPERHKPVSISIEEHIENRKKSIKRTKDEILKLMEGDIELYNKLKPSMDKWKYTD